MLFKTATIFNTLLLTLSQTTQAQETQECKTVTTVENFNITAYASAPWYVHQQAESSYLPIERNYCVKAEYNIFEEPTYLGYTVDVNNQAQNMYGSSVGASLCAYQTDETSLSKLAVAPCFLPTYFAGPYWVVAYDEQEGYALISGGQPTIVSEGTNGLCTSGDGINNSGLWIFSRSQIRDDTLVSTVRDIAEAAGFDLSVLNDVIQTDCDLCTDSEQLCDENETDSETICEWVNNAKWDWMKHWRCFMHGDICPDTCERCNE
jgi:lipocalin